MRNRFPFDVRPGNGMEIPNEKKLLRSSFYLEVKQFNRYNLCSPSLHL